MRAIIKYFMIFLVCLFTAVTLAWAMRSYSTVQYDLVMQQPGMSQGITTKVYTKGKKSRMEMQAGGTQSMTIFDGVQAYMYIPSQNMAVAVPMQAARSQVPMIEDYQKDCQYLGDETVDGKYCGVYNCAKGASPVKMWIDKAMDFPAKTESQGATAYYKNVVFDAPIEDGMFSLPAGVKPQDMATMMQGMQGMGTAATGQTEQ